MREFISFAPVASRAGALELVVVGVNLVFEAVAVRDLLINRVVVIKRPDHAERDQDE
jgi:hypothetical protein